MHDFDRLREFLPFAAALYLGVSVAHLQAAPAVPHHAHAISFADVIAGLKRHMIEVGNYERAAMMAGGFQGD